MQFFRSFLKSPPFEDYLKELRSRLEKEGVRTNLFRSSLYHQWFMCMWTSRRRKKLQAHLEDYDAVIVLGCDSAAETVRDLAKSTDVQVLEGMEVAGIMNARLALRLPCDLCFEDCKVVPISPDAPA